VTTISDVQQAVSQVAGSTGLQVVGVSGRRSAGSGVVVSKDRVLTNEHNLMGEEITVTFPDGRTAPAKPLGVDTVGDVAVLEVPTNGSGAIEWSDGAPSIGAPVFAVANPGGRGLRVTFGLVSGTERTFRGPRGRKIGGSIEHTAPLLPGSSGGPIVDESGKLIGINTHRLGEGFYLAIPADDALKQRVDALGKGESPKRVRLGVAIVPSHIARRLRRSVGLPEVDGLLVRGVEDDSPASKAGLQQGDLITSANGRDLATADDLFAAMEGSNEVELGILRGTEQRTVKVTF
jgi:serine protease Do